MKKPVNPLRPILWSFGVMIFLMTLLFGMGLFYQSVLGKIEGTLAARPSVADLETRLSKRIGQPYDRKHHDQLITLLDSETNARASLLEASNALSNAVLQVAGASTLLALWTVFLLLRKSHGFLRAPDSPGERFPSEQ